MTSRIVRVGTTFGGDFVLYPGLPTEFHASYVVAVVAADGGRVAGPRGGVGCSLTASWRELQSTSRVAGAVSKTTLVATVDTSGGVEPGVAGGGGITFTCVARAPADSQQVHRAVIRKGSLALARDVQQALGSSGSSHPQRKVARLGGVEEWDVYQRATRPGGSDGGGDAAVEEGGARNTAWFLPAERWVSCTDSLSCFLVSTSFVRLPHQPCYHEPPVSAPAFARTKAV